MTTSTTLSYATPLTSIAIRVRAKDARLLPTFASKGAAGADVRAHVPENSIIAARKTALIPTGLFFEIPEGYEIQIRPRSGLALRYGVTLLNSPGTIDSDYRGEVGVIVINHSDVDFIVEPYMRIAQLVVAPTLAVQFIPSTLLSETERGAGGFGHTGTS